MPQPYETSNTNRSNYRMEWMYSWNLQCTSTMHSAKQLNSTFSGFKSELNVDFPQVPIVVFEDVMCPQQTTTLTTNVWSPERHQESWRWKDAPRFHRRERNHYFDKSELVQRGKGRSAGPKTNETLEIVRIQTRLLKSLPQCLRVWSTVWP